MFLYFQRLWIFRSEYMKLCLIMVTNISTPPKSGSKKAYLCSLILEFFFFQNFHCLKNDHVILKELSSWKTLKSQVNCSYITLKKYVIHPTTWKFKVFHQHWIGLLHQSVGEPCGPMKNFRSFKSIVHFISTLREHFYCCTLIIDDNLWMAHWK